MAHTSCTACTRPVPDAKTLCRTCGDNTVNDLLAIPALVTELSTTRAGLGRTEHHARRRPAETPLPIRATSHGLGIHGDAALQILTTHVHTWAHHLAEQLHTHIPYDAPGLTQLAVNARTTTADRHRDTLTEPVTTVEQAAIWLACHPHQLRDHDNAAEYATTIRTSITDIEHLIDLPTEPRHIGPCPTCDTDIRVHCDNNGQLPAWVRCPHCHEQHDTVTVRNRALALARERLCTIEEIARIAHSFDQPVSRHTLYRRARNGTLQPRGYLHRDRDRDRITDHPTSSRDARVYRLGDVFDHTHTYGR